MTRAASVWPRGPDSNSCAVELEPLDQLARRVEVAAVDRGLRLRGEVRDRAAGAVDQPREVAEPALQLARAGGLAAARLAALAGDLAHRVHGAPGDRAADAAGHQRADDDGDDEQHPRVLGCRLTPLIAHADTTSRSRAATKRPRTQPQAGTGSRSRAGLGGRTTSANSTHATSVACTSGTSSPRFPIVSATASKGHNTSAHSAEVPVAGQQIERAHVERPGQPPEQHEREHVLADLDRVLSRGA